MTTTRSRRTTTFAALATLAISFIEAITLDSEKAGAVTATPPAHRMLCRQHRIARTTAMITGAPATTWRCGTVVARVKDLGQFLGAVAKPRGGIGGRWGGKALSWVGYRVYIGI